MSQIFTCPESEMFWRGFESLIGLSDFKGVKNFE